MNQRGFSQIILLVIAVGVVLAIGGGALYYKKAAKTKVVDQVILDSFRPSTFEESAIPQSQKPQDNQKPQDKAILDQTQEKIKSPIKIKWSQLNGPPGGGYWSISIAPSNPNITKDGGTIWYGVDNNQIGSGESEGVTALAVDDHNPDIVYAGQDNEFYQSSDFGKTWKKLSEIPGSTIRSIAVSNYIYVMNSGSGLWKSGDNGRTFSKVDEVSSASSYHYLFHDKTVGDIYFATADGLYKYSGENWKRLPQFNSEIQPISVSGAGNIVYVTAADKSVYKSEDGGDSWRTLLSVDDIRVHHGYNFPVAMHPANSDIVYIGLGHLQEVGKELTTTGEQGLFRSVQGGNKWERVEGLPKIQPSRIRFHPSDPNIIFVTFGEHICGACAAEIDKNGKPIFN